MSKIWVNLRQHFLGDALTFLFGMGMAIFLFWHGLTYYRMDVRVTGDAFEYMEIASHFKNLKSALSFVGERSVGMPLFDWIFSPSISLVEKNFETWSIYVGIALLIIHIFASVFATFLAKEFSPIKTRLGLRLFFIFLVSFPALIGHTTTPLTDTLAVDLTLFLLGTMLLSNSLKGLASLILSILIGVIATYSCLLRPAYLIPLILSMLLFTGISAFNRKWFASVSLIVFAGLLGVVSSQCHDLYGKVCLQNPQTFEPERHAQMGLRGGRLLWSIESSIEGEFAIVPDSFLKESFYDRCKLKHIVGFGKDSLTGCLMLQPHKIPTYIFKKWVGLFDNFRFQPYVEIETPSWLRNLSRSYDALAWVGFLFLGFSIIQILIRSMVTIEFNPAIVSYLSFVVLMLAEHTILHPEDRFGLVVMPFAGIGMVLFAEKIHNLIQKKLWSKLILPIGFALIAVGLFVMQIYIWDITVYSV